MPSFKVRDLDIAVTFRDVVLLPGYTSVEPREVDLATKVTKRRELSVPIVSSPMDTVTEAEMAIAMARLGGLGVLHRNCTVDEQVEMARTVKRAESFIIRDVVTLTPDQTVGDALKIMEAKSISGLPVVDSEGRLVGIITRRDVAFAEDLSAKVAEVMTKKVITVGEDITVEEAKRIMRKHKIEKLPVVDEKGFLKGLITMKDLVSRERFPNASRDEQGRLLVAAAISPFDLERAKRLDRWVDILVMDVAHFHNENCMSAAAKLLKEVSAEVIIGNIGTYRAAEDVITKLEDVAGLRVGIASGSICITGEVTGEAAPTLFAVMEVARALHDYGADIPIIADGGIRSSGDAAKALAAGASAVMCGFLLAGCKEAPGAPVVVGGKMYKYYRGMGSPAARAKRFAKDRYQQPAKEIAEGVEGLVPYRGEVATVLRELIAGLQASFGYVGARSIRELWEKARFALITPIGRQEIGGHDIIPMERTP